MEDDVNYTTYFKVNGMLASCFTPEEYSCFKSKKGLLEYFLLEFRGETYFCFCTRVFSPQEYAQLLEFSLGRTCLFFENEFEEKFELLLSQ